MAIPFSYATFWKWFRDDPEHVLTPTSDVFATVYSVDYPAIKYRSLVAAPFLTRNMRAMRVANDDALRAHFSGELFAVMDAAAFGEGNEPARVKAARKKNLFVVFPKVLQHEGAPLVIADHYSLRVARKARRLRQAALVDDGGRRGTPLHFHLTQYFPAQGGYGTTLADDNYMPLNFTLPADDEAFKATLTNEHLRTYFAAQIRSVLSRPWAAQTGGGHAARRHRQRQRAIVAPDASFDDLWRTLPLSRITIFGIAVSTGGFDVTVFLNDRLHHTHPSATRRGYAFHVTRPSAIPATIARLMGGLCWNDFYDPKDPADEM